MEKDNEMLETTAPEDEEIMLPEGYQENEDIFEAKEDVDGFDEEQQEDLAAEEEKTGEEGEEPAQEQQEAEQPAAVENFLKFKDGELEVVIKESDIEGLYRRAQERDGFNGQLQNLQQQMERLNSDARALGFQNAQEMFGKAADSFRDAEVKRLVSEGMHEEAAKDLVARKMPRAAQPAAQAVATARDFRKELGELVQHRPDLRESLNKGGKLPEEVITACFKDNVPLRAAYAEHEAKEVKAELERIRQENEILKQNAANAKRAPVKSTAGSATAAKSKDPFLAGFDSDN